MSTNKASEAVRGGNGFLTLLTILFIALKLTGVIHWSWVWVLAPLWISWAVGVVILIGIGVFLFVLKRREAKLESELRERRIRTGR